MPIAFPEAADLQTANDVAVDAYPEMAAVRRTGTVEVIDDVATTTRRAVDELGMADLPPGAEIGITAGSRGIHDLPTVLAALVSELSDRGYAPFVIPAMGSHGGATADGQRETLAALGITEGAMGCPIRSSMAVDAVGEDADGRPIYVARDALAADGVVLLNRIKPHTDFAGPVESGLCKMAVVGLGKHRGAAALHEAGLAGDFATVIQDRAARIIGDAPIVGGIGLVDGPDERVTHIEGIPPDRITEREPALLERAYAELQTLPIDALDVLIVDEIGKEISGTGMDTNVLGRYRFYDEPEPSTPTIDRVFARSLTPASHGNAVGIGLADVVHRRLAAQVDLTETYINVVTSGEPERAKLPLIVPDDRTGLELLPATVGVDDPATLRIARIRNTLELGSFLVSTPVAQELRAQPDYDVGPASSLDLDGNDLPPAPYR